MRPRHADRIINPQVPAKAVTAADDGHSIEAGPPSAEGGVPVAGAGGEYRIADDVVAAIAGMAAAAVPGVAGLGGSLPLGLSEVLAKRHATRGVRVEMGTREAAIDLHLQVRYGVQIPAVAQRVQESVKRSIEAMTGLDVVEVNVYVQGLDSGGPTDAAPARDPQGAV